MRDKIYFWLGAIAIAISFYYMLRGIGARERFIETGISDGESITPGLVFLGALFFWILYILIKERLPTYKARRDYSNQRLKIKTQAPPNTPDVFAEPSPSRSNRASSKIQGSKNKPMKEIESSTNTFLSYADWHAEFSRLCIQKDPEKAAFLDFIEDTPFKVAYADGIDPEIVAEAFIRDFDPLNTPAR